MHLNFIRLVFLCSSLVVHAVTAMPVVTLSNADISTTEDSTFTQGNVGSPENLSVVSGRSSTNSLVLRSDDQRSDGTPPSPSTVIGSHSSSWGSTETLVHEPLVNPNPIVKIKFQNVQSRTIGSPARRSPNHIFLWAGAQKLLEIVKEVFNGHVVQVQDPWLNYHHIEVVDTNHIVSLNIEITECAEIEGTIVDPRQISIDIIGWTVAAVHFGDGKWIFAGIANIIRGQGDAVKFTEQPTTTYGNVKVVWGRDREIQSSVLYPFVVEKNQRQVVGFGR
ncbi:hypothetical protein FB446DRAFT_718057 [Lentinula raphanica]|nr:hypothetical protein FB446DRAFT_718057 [Lentinula raphanica]